MKYCPKCGAPNSDDAVFCTSCGNKFEAVPQPNMNQQQYQGNNPPPGSIGGTTYGGQPTGTPNQQYYGSSQGFNIDNMFANDYQTSKTLILIAFIFSIIAIVIFVISGISNIINALAISASYTSYGLAVPITVSYLYAYSVVYLIMFIFSIIVFLRVKRIYDVLKSGNIQQALALNSLTWGIIALIFAGVITGIMMILARNYMESALGMQH